MNDLLARILDAHGGVDRWNGYEKVDATIVSGGGFFALKGVLQDSNPRRMTVRLHEERSSVLPYGAPDQRTMFTPERIAIEKLDGTLVAERHAPRDSFSSRPSQMSHTMGTPLASCLFQRRGPVDLSHHAPFFFSRWMAVRVQRRPRRGGRVRRRGTCCVHTFPARIETHCLVQDFFFGEDLMLCRHDYSVNIAGGFGASQLTSDYVEANGIRLPTKRRAHTRGPDQPADPRNADGVDRH